MEDKTTIVFRGFLNLNAKEKMELVSSINEYFDSTAREPIRAANDERYELLGVGTDGPPCVCCGR